MGFPIDHRIKHAHSRISNAHYDKAYHKAYDKAYPMDAIYNIIRDKAV